MSETDLLKTLPTLQAVALVKSNVDELKKKKTKLAKEGVKNLIGISLIGLTANSIK